MLSLSTINIKSSKNITKIKELQKEFNNLHFLIRVPSYDELVEKNLDVIMKNYLKYLNCVEESNPYICDLVRYDKLRKMVSNSDSTISLGERWSFWKNRIEKNHIQSFNDTDESSRKAILVVRNAFQDFGKEVGDVLSELIQKGKKTVVGTRELEEAEAELAEIQKMKRDAERIKDYVQSAALYILEVSLERDIKFFAIDRKREEKNKKRKIEEDIKKTQFFSERNGKKNVVVRDIEGYSNFEMYISDWELGIREEINWLNISWEIKEEMIKKLEEILHSKAPFYSSTSFPETKNNSYTFEKMLEDNKNSALHEIAGALEEVGLSQNDLLIENQNYQDQLQTAVENWDLVGIEDIKDRLLTDIKRDRSSDNDQPNKNDKKDTENYSLERNNKWRAGCIRNIINSMKQEPKITDEDLSIENQNWQEKLNACQGNGEVVFMEISKIYIRIKTNIKEVREEKQKASELNSTRNKYQENNNQISQDEMVNDLRKINLNLGEEDKKHKLRETKKLMKQHNSELFFSSFVKLVEEEIEKYEAERKRITESKPNLEIKFNEGERKLLDREITDLSEKEKEKLIENIEIKVEIGKKSLSWYKKIEKWRKWLKTKANLLLKNNKVSFETQKSRIEEEVENFKKSSNTFDRQAYQANQQETNKLLSELRNISQDNIENNDKLISLPVFIGGMAILVSSLVGILIILRSRKKQRN